MRKALGLDKESQPLPPKKFKDRLKYRTQTEVGLRCRTQSGEVITFHHNEQTISIVEALCHANMRARKFGLKVLWTEYAEIKERPYVVPR